VPFAIGLVFLGLLMASRSRGGGGVSPLGPVPSPSPLNHDSDPLGTLARGGGNAGSIPLGSDLSDVRESAEQVNAPASESDAQEAAHGLAVYLNTGGRNRDAIRGYQRRMGHLTVDGIVGPQTQARMRALGARV